VFDTKRTMIKKDLDVLEERMRQRPYQFFVPTASGFDLIKAVGTLVPEKRIFLATSANGVGKTTTVANILFSIMYGNCNLFSNIKNVQTGETIPGFFDFPLYNHYPDDWPKVFWYVTNRDAASIIWDQKFKRWFPPNLYQAGKAGKTYVSEMKFPGAGWLGYFKTIDQEEDAFQTADVGVICFDEIPPRDILMSCVSRLRSGGIIIITATPLYRASYFQEDIVDHVNDPGSDKWAIQVPVWDNCIEKGGEWDLGRWGIQPKGNLWLSNIEAMIRNYDADEYEARVNGAFQYFSGLVYKVFDEKRHKVFMPSIHLPYRYSYRFLIDPHERRPPYACWLRYDQDNKPYAMREWPSIEDPEYQRRPFHLIKNADPLVISDFVKAFCAIEDELGIPNDRITQSIMDPNYGLKPERVEGLTVRDLYEEEFARQGRPRTFIVEAMDSLEQGHKFVKEWLSIQGGFHVDPSMVDMVWGFKNYKYDQLTGKAAEKKDISIKVLEKGKDECDVIRYAAVVPYEYSPPDPTALYVPTQDFGDAEEEVGGEWHRNEGSDFV
jgi:phage terminase large subunit-like protein